jgi:UDP-N-acetyl-2-amino-2-deoxyglucuronate dehydrogenase
MSDLRVALVGCGRISRRHVEAIRANRGIHVAAVCDTVEARGRAVSELAGVPWVARIADLPDVDVVTIATPSGLHPRHAVQAAEETSATYVVCEKPLSLTLRELVEMYRGVNNRGRRLLPVYQNRYNPLVVFLRDLFRSGRLGRVYQFNVNVMWNRSDEYFGDGWHGSLELDGGVLYTQASHYVDMLLYFFGELKDAKGYGARLRGRPAYDTVSAVFEFASGTVGSLNTTIGVYRTNYLSEATVIAERGTIRVGGTNLNTIEFWDVEGMDKPDIDFKIDHVYGKGHDTLYRYVAEGRWEMFPTYEEVSSGIALMEKLSF